MEDRYCSLLRVEDGKVVEGRDFYDSATIGVHPRYCSFTREMLTHGTIMAWPDHCRKKDRNPMDGNNRKNISKGSLVDVVRKPAQYPCTGSCSRMTSYFTVSPERSGRPCNNALSKTSFAITCQPGGNDATA